MIYKAVVCFSYRLFFAHFCHVCICFIHFNRSISFALASINILISILAVRILCGKEEQSSSEQKKNLNKHSLRRKKRRPFPSVSLSLSIFALLSLRRCNYLQMVNVIECTLGIQIIMVCQHTIELRDDKLTHTHK